MTISLLCWLCCFALAIAGLAALNWQALRRVRRAVRAEELHLAERWRVLSNYARLRDGRAYHPKRYPEAVYTPERRRRS